MNIRSSPCYAKFVILWSQSRLIAHRYPDYAIQNKLTPFISMQNHYNVVYREEEREMFPTLKHFGVGSIPWSPLAKGLLTRPLGAEVNTVRSKDP